MIVLGIETSCDETAAAVVGAGRTAPARILSDIVLSARSPSTPPSAAWCRRSPPAPMSRRSTASSRRRCARPASASPTSTASPPPPGPGLIGGVMVGLTTAKAIALAAGKPLVAVNHLEGHALSARLTDGRRLSLSAAAGLRRPLPVPRASRASALPPPRLDHRRRGRRGLRQDRPRCSASAYPGGPAVERAAKGGDPARASPLPRPLLGRPGCDFSFSGLKTAAARSPPRRSRRSASRDDADLAAVVQAAVTDVVADRAAPRHGAVRGEHRAGRDAALRRGRRRRRQPRGPRRRCSGAPRRGASLRAAAARSAPTTPR